MIDEPDFLPYQPPVLEWERLGSSISPHPLSSEDGYDDSSSGICQEDIIAILQDKPWMLMEDNDTLNLPPTHLDDMDYAHIYLLSDFCREVDKKAAKDVEACAAAAATRANNGHCGATGHSLEKE